MTTVPTAHFTLPEVLAAINALYAPGAVQISEIDKYLKSFQRDPSAWGICTQLLQAESLPPSVIFPLVIVKFYPKNDTRCIRLQ